MDKFFSLLVRPEPLTDAEYVEQVRRNVERSRRYGIWFLPLLLGFMVGLGWAAQTLFLALFGVVFAWQGGPNLEVVLGLVTGFVLGVAGAKLLMILVIPWDDRSLELLVQYYDALEERGYLAGSRLPPQNRRDLLIDRLSQKKLLGLPVISRRPTDAEYVERMRAADTRGRRLASRLFVPFVITSFGVWVCMLCFCVWRGVGPGGNQFLLALAGGIVAGAIFGLLVLVTAHYYVDLLFTLKRNRTAELLVMYHDMLVDLARAESQSLLAEEAGQGRAGETAIESD
jgi:hypothetical protein